MKSKTLFLFLIITLLLAGCNLGPSETLAPTQIDIPTATVEPVATDPSGETGEPVEAIFPTATADEAALPEDSSSTQSSSPTEVAPPPETEAPPPPVDAASWQNLPFDEFVEESWYSVMRRDPETLTELGLSAAFGIGDDQLTDISDAYLRETYALYAQILEFLYTYDRDSLSPEQQLNYDIYAYYLEDVLRGEAFINYDYPITHFIIGVQYQLINFFTDIHPVTNLQNAQDYVTRLSQVDTKFEQVIANLQLSEQAGVVTPRFILQWSLGDIRNIANSSAKYTTFYTSFAEKVNALDSLSDEEKTALLEAAEAEIKASVIPGFRALADYLDDLQRRAPTDDGVWQYPNGDAYYAYQVARFTTTDLTPDEIHQMGLADLARIQTEMRQIFDQLGYPADESLPQLFDRVEQDGGALYGQDIVAGYEAIIADAQLRANEVLDLQPQSEVIVIPGSSGGYYIGPSVDGSRPGAFYASVGGSEPRFGMASLAYHEAVPGHHTQVALALELDLPSFRRGSLFTAYVEGWALYAERLMSEIGAYADDPHGDLGRLQYEAFRAARLVVDTGIHAKGWTFDEAVDFMVANTGMPNGNIQFEVARYIAWPAQALTYKIGMEEILRLRTKAQEQLGDRFDIREFHNLVLGNGAVPLAILERLVDEYIASNLGS